MKRILSAFFLILMLAVFTLMPFEAAAQADDQTDVTINVYNWGQYIADGSEGSMDVLAEFTKRTGIKVNYMTFDTNEALYAKLKNGGSSYDVIIPSDYMISRLIEEDMLEKLDFSNIPNYSNIDEQFKNTDYDPNNEYSVPYTWGTVGIIYNSKYVTKPVDSWNILWDEDYKGKILMFDNPRDAFGIAQFLLGNSINTTDEAEIRAAADKLSEQTPIVQQYVMDQIFSSMENEEAWIATYYAGDFLIMNESNENLEFCYPKEGFNRFIDGLCIPKGAQHKAEAEAFINFICDPEISGANLDYIGYSTPITAAKDYLDESVANSEVAYPSEEVLSQGVSFTALPADKLQLMDKLWIDVKASANSGSGSSWIIYAAVGAAAVIIIAVLVIRKRRRSSMYD